MVVPLLSPFSEIALLLTDMVLEPLQDAADRADLLCGGAERNAREFPDRNRGTHCRVSDPRPSL